MIRNQTSQNPPHVKDSRFDSGTTRSISEPGGSILERPIRFRNRAVRFWKRFNVTSVFSEAYHDSDAATTSLRTELTEVSTD